MKKSIFCIFFILLNFTKAFSDWSGENVAVDTDTTGEGFYRPKIAMNSSGYVVATWGKYDPVSLQSTLQAATSLDFGKTWGSSIPVDAANPSKLPLLLDPDIAIDSSNSAIIVWNRFSAPFTSEVKAAQYIANTIPGPSITVLASDSNFNALSHYPQIAMNNLGNAIAIWYGIVGGDKSHIKSQYSTTDAGASWNPPTSDIDPSIPAGVFVDYHPSIVMNATKALVAWTYRPTIEFGEIRTSNSGDNGDNWLNVNLVSTSSYSDQSFLAMDASNNAIIVWRSYEGGLFYPKVAFSSDGGNNFSNGINLDQEPGYDNTYPQVAMDNFGNAIAVWTYYDSKLKGFIKTAYSSDYGQTFSEAKLVDNSPSDEGLFARPQVAMDEHGNAVVIWERFLGSDYEIRVANSTDLGKHWEVRLLDSVRPTIIPGNETYIAPQALINTQEAANVINEVAIWTNQETGLSQVLTQSFTDSILKATGDQEKVRAFLQIELLNRLKTNPIGQLGTFRFYNDAALTQLLASVTNINEIATFIDHDVRQGETKTYYITWTNFSGTIGPITVTINGS